MILGNFDWTYFFVTAPNGMISNVIVSYALLRLLHTRHRIGYWVTALLFTIIILVIKQYFPPEAFAILGAVGIIVVYAFFLEGSLVVRIVMGVLSQVFLLFAEVPTGIVWVALTHSPTMNTEATLLNLPAFLLASLFHMIFLAVLMYWFYWVFNRAMYAQSERSEQKVSGLRGGVFILFPCAQFLLMLLLFVVAFFFIGDEISPFVSLMALCTIYALVDVFLFIRMRDYLDLRFSNLRATVIAQQVDTYLQTAASMQDSLKSAAALRHDLRSHVQVVEGLCERGEHQKAQVYLCEAAQRIG